MKYGIYRTTFCILVTLSISMAFRIVFGGSVLPKAQELQAKQQLPWYVQYYPSWGNSTIRQVGTECGLQRVAFVIPYYSETAGALRRTILSLVHQKRFYWHYKIIISDDGGPHPERPHSVVSWLLKSNLLPSCSSATVVRGANGQLPMARNRAIASLPTGIEWVVPVDTGDTLNEEFMHLSVEATERNPNVHVIHPHLCTLKGYQWDPPNVAAATKPLHTENVFHCCPMFRRSLWDSAGGYDSSFTFGWEDWDFWVRANASVGLVAVNLPEKCLYMYDPGESHTVCQLNKAACKAAFATAHGSLNTVKDTLLAHDQLLKSQDFLGNDVLLRQHRKHPEMPLMWLWTGILREAQGDIQAALQKYEGAIERDSHSHPGMRTRGVGWQAAYRGATMLRELNEVTQLGEWCKRVRGVVGNHAEVVGCVM